MPNQRVYILNMLHDERPDIDDALDMGTPFSTLDKAKAYAQLAANNFADEMGEEEELVV